MAWKRPPTKSRWFVNNLLKYQEKDAELLESNYQYWSENVSSTFLPLWTYGTIWGKQEKISKLSDRFRISLRRKQSDDCSWSSESSARNKNINVTSKKSLPEDFPQDLEMCSPCHSAHQEHWWIILNYHFDKGIPVKLHFPLSQGDPRAHFCLHTLKTKKHTLQTKSQRASPKTNETSWPGHRSQVPKRDQHQQPAAQPQQHSQPRQQQQVQQH